MFIVCYFTSHAFLSLNPPKPPHEPVVLLKRREQLAQAVTNALTADAMTSQSRAVSRTDVTLNGRAERIDKRIDNSFISKINETGVKYSHSTSDVGVSGGVLVVAGVRPRPSLFQL